MKKLMALSLALLMTLSLVACGSKTEQALHRQQLQRCRGHRLCPLQERYLDLHLFRRRRLRHLLPPDR